MPISEYLAMIGVCGAGIVIIVGPYVGNLLLCRKIVRAAVRSRGRSGQRVAAMITAAQLLPALLFLLVAEPAPQDYLRTLDRPAEVDPATGFFKASIDHRPDVLAGRYVDTGRPNGILMKAYLLSNMPAMITAYVVALPFRRAGYLAYSWATYSVLLLLVVLHWQVLAKWWGAKKRPPIDSLDSWRAS